MDLFTVEKSGGRLLNLGGIALLCLLFLIQPTATFSADTYQIVHGTSRKSLTPDYSGNRDDKRNASVWPAVRGDNGFRWIFEYAGSDPQGHYFYIINVNSGLVLTQDGDSEVNVSTWGRLPDKHPRQHWRFVPHATDNMYMIINRGTGQGLTQHDGGTRADKNNVTTWPGQRWANRGWNWYVVPAGSADMAVLTIQKVKCIKPSTGQDAATSVLFSAIEIVAQVGAAAATGGASLAASAAFQGFKAAGRTGAKTALKNITKKQLLDAAKKKAKKEVKKIPKKLAKDIKAEQERDNVVGEALDYTSLEGIFNKIHGDTPDDLEIRVNNRSVWPNGGRDYRQIKSQQTHQINTPYIFEANKGFNLQLVEYDYGSDDDSLGWIIWRKQKDGYGPVEDRVVVRDSEGSVYEVSYNVQPLYQQPASSFRTTRPYNVAELKTARQSSIAFQGGADRAIDGITNGDYRGGSVTHTNLDNQAWWEVDLGKIYNIRQIRVYNRTDCCRERLSNFRISVSSSPFASNESGVLYGYVNGYNPADPLVFNRTVRARYVRIFLLGRQHLSLTEVQIIGTP